MILGSPSVQYSIKTLMQVLLAQACAEVRRIKLPGRLGNKFVRPHLNRKKLGMAAHACYLCNVGKLKIGA
jgi:hypothetical protein